MRDSANCTVVRHDGFVVHTSKDLAGTIAKIARGEPRMGTCRSARLLTRSTFDECAAACLGQPFCEAVTWIDHGHVDRRLRGSCFGRTAGTPATWVDAASFEANLTAARSLVA